MAGTVELDQQIEQVRQQLQDLERQRMQAGIAEEAEIARTAALRRAREKSDNAQWQFMRHDTTDKELLAVAKVLAYQAALPMWCAVRWLQYERGIKQLERRVQELEQEESALASSEPVAG